MHINFQQDQVSRSVKKPCTQIYFQEIANCMNLQLPTIILTRCTRGVRVVFSRARMRSSNSAPMNKSNFFTRKIVFTHNDSVF